MNLYFAPRTRSVRPRWLLEELGVPYDLVRIDLAKGENRTPAFLSLNPLGEVPVLVDGATTLFTSPSILLYLGDRFPERQLAPPVGSAARADYLQWLLFSEVTLDPVVVDFLPRDQKVDLDAQRSRLEDLLAIIERRLEGRSFLAGDAFTAADLSMASILHLAHNLKLLDQHPKLFEYVLLHTKRPATRRAVAG